MVDISFARGRGASVVENRGRQKEGGNLRNEVKVFPLPTISTREGFLKVVIYVHKYFRNRLVGIYARR